MGVVAIALAINITIIATIAAFATAIIKIIKRTIAAIIITIAITIVMLMANVVTAAPLPSSMQASSSSTTERPARHVLAGACRALGKSRGGTCSTAARLFPARRPTMAA